MKKYLKKDRGFYHLSRSWYGENILRNEKYLDDVTCGYYDTDGGTYGEMVMRWYPLQGEVVPCLECFNDAWGVLGSIQDVIKELAKIDDMNITPNEFCDILKRCGFKDKTSTKRK